MGTFYPGSELTTDRTVEAWLAAFHDTDPARLREAFRLAVLANEKGFVPTPGQVQTQLQKVPDGSRTKPNYFAVTQSMEFYYEQEQRRHGLVKRTAIGDGGRSIFWYERADK